MTSGSGRLSLNCTSSGSPPSGATATWYHPGSAHSVSRLHFSSERRADQVTVNQLAFSRRSTRSLVGTAFGHCWLVQIRSSPEVILSVSVSREACQVQAGLSRVSILKRSVTSRPATASFTTGVTSTSASRHGPLGCGRAGFFFLFFFLFFFFLSFASWVASAVGEAASLEGAPAETGVTAPPPPAPSENRLSVRPSPTTSASAVPSTRNRRVQYVRAASGPRGRVSALMRSP